MKITTTKNNGCLTLELEGRLDTTTAPELETVIKNGLEGVDRLVLDMEGQMCIRDRTVRIQKTMTRIKPLYSVCHPV